MKKVLLYKLLGIATIIVLFFGCVEDEKILSISISQTEAYDFPSATGENYPAVEPLTVTITNTGTEATGRITIAVDGPAALDFDLSVTTVDNIEVGKDATFTVAPKTGLANGDYRATIYVSGKGIAEKSFDIRFVVTELQIASIELISGPVKTVYGVKEPFDTTGIVVQGTDVDGIKSIIELKEEYLQYDFSVPDSLAKVTIAVGSAPVIQIPVMVLSIADRVASVKGESVVLYLYSDETVDKRIRNDHPNTTVVITTPENSTTVRKLKLATNGVLLSMSGGSKIIVDGYVTLQGYATPEYGGTDEKNNTFSLVVVGTEGELILKGHTKVTGNAYVLDDPEDVSILGGGITVRGHLTLDENAQISNNTICCAKPFPSPWNAEKRNGKIAWGGGVYITGAEAVMEIKGNAKITGNRAINKGGNAYGGAVFPEVGATIKMSGGEISGNSAEASHRAGGGALHLTTGILAMTGGVIKDNVVIYGGAGTGPACVVDLNDNRLVLSGSASIPAKSGTRLSELTNYTTITGVTMRQDIGNTIWLNGGMIARVGGTLTGDAPVATFDINKTTTMVLGKYDLETGIASDYTNDCPVDKFALHSYLIITAPYASLDLEAVTDKVIKADGTVGAP